MSERALYLDASALVKLVHREAETDSLRAYLAASQALQLTSVVSSVELPRSVTAPESDPALVRALLDHLSLIALDADVVRRASSLDPPGLGSLDAIHLASALGIRSALDAFVTYDEQLADAARLHGLPVAAPAPGQADATGP